MIEFTVPGRPVPAARMTQRGKWVRRSAQRYLAYKDKVGWAARQVIKAPIEGPVGLGLLAYIAKGQPGDLDNIIKAIQDGLNGIAWIDDRQVVELQAKRIKAGPDRVVIRIWEVDQEAG